MKAVYTLILILLSATAYAQTASNWIQEERTGCKVFNLAPEPNESVQITGNCANGYLEGQGTVVWYLNGKFNEKSEGFYLKGKLNGQGTINYANGNKVVGDFKDGRVDGQLIATAANGSKFVGEVKDGKRNGQGIQYSSSGSIQESGIYKDNVLVTSQYVDPNSVGRTARNNATPSASDAQRLAACLGSDSTKWSNCFGSFSATNGDKLFGEFKDGKIHGQGTNAFINGEKYVGEFRDGKRNGTGTYSYQNGDKYVGEWKDDKRNGQGIKYSASGNISESGIYKDGSLVTSQYVDPNRFTVTARNNPAPAVSDSQRQAIEQRERQIELEAQRVAEERRKLEEDKRQRELAKRSSRISIAASATQPDASGVVTINIQTNTDTSSLKINGEELGGKADGNYAVQRVARVGQETKFVFVATDLYGNTDSKTVTVVRQAVDSKAVFTQLNAANVKQQPVRDAVAIIIGIEKYKRVAKADYAKDDAKDFYDYASRALGIKPENIKLLIDDGADDVEILQAFQNWLPLKVKKGKTDVYVFFSGHGYPSEDGKGLYFLPYGVDKNYMDRTAVKQKEVVSALQAVQPKSVTMFIDSCYSGQTRGGETLVAGSKPIALKQNEAAYPPEFTVITASTMDQISWSSPDLKHGLFSYYLMKGMEGEADQNKDGKITVAEIQEYLTDMVGRQAMGMNRKQQPQLFGDADRVLVGR